MLKKNYSFPQHALDILQRMNTDISATDLDQHKCLIFYINTWINDMLENNVGHDKIIKSIKKTNALIRKKFLEEHDNEHIQMFQYITQQLNNIIYMLLNRY